MLIDTSRRENDERLKALEVALTGTVYEQVLELERLWSLSSDTSRDASALTSSSSSPGPQTLPSLRMRWQ